MCYLCWFCKKQGYLHVVSIAPSKHQISICIKKKIKRKKSCLIVAWRKKAPWLHLFNRTEQHLAPSYEPTVLVRCDRWLVFCSISFLSSQYYHAIVIFTSNCELFVTGMMAEVLKHNGTAAPCACTPISCVDLQIEVGWSSFRVPLTSAALRHSISGNYYVSWLSLLVCWLVLQTCQRKVV